MTALVEAATAKDYPAEIAVVVSNRPEAPGLARAREAGVATAIVDHTQFGADREAFERALDAELREAADRSCVPGRIYAAFDAVVRDPLERPDAQHSSVAAAAIQGASHPPPGARSRRETARRYRPLRRAGNGCGTDRRAGFGRGARGRHRSKRSPSACWRSSTASIRKRCARWRKAGQDCRLVDSENAAARAARNLQKAAPAFRIRRQKQNPRCEPRGTSTGIFRGTAIRP